MRKIILLLCCIHTLSIYAQKPSDKATKQACDCMDKLDMKLPADQLDAQFEKCMTDAVVGNLAGLSKEYKFSIEDENAATEVGKKLGMKLASNCPSFLQYAMVSNDNEDKNKNEKYEFIEGVIKEINQNGYLSFSIEEASGDVRVFYLIQYFAGAEDIENQINTLKNKKVKLGFTIQKIFDVASNSFKDKKVIDSFIVLK
jgi:hypothetical protein